MLHLIRYSAISKIKYFNCIFWPLFFPVILATLFYFAFGTLEEADFEKISAAVVTEKEASDPFLTFLEEMQKEDGGLLETEYMTKAEAEEALGEKKISGIFYVEDEVRLAVNGNGMSQSILEAVLESYENGKQTLMTVAKTHPEGMEQAVLQMEQYSQSVEQVSLGGRTTNGYVQFFYALIAMACLYGSFIGLRVAQDLQADICPLAARRNVSPAKKRTLIFTEMLTSFVFHTANVLILIFYMRFVLGQELGGSWASMALVAAAGSIIGVSMGMFVGSISHLGEGAKVGILLGISMSCCFFAGLMNGEMKYVVEKTVPLANRINPAALITDALYCINVYEDGRRFAESIGILAAMAAVLLTLCVIKTRRERYDSI